MDKKSPYWFKRRRYGWGWIPVTLAGWLSLATYIAIIVGAAMYLLPQKPAQPSRLQITTYLLVFLAATLVLVGISYAKGPLPRWRWGKAPHDNDDEDF